MEEVHAAAACFLMAPPTDKHGSESADGNGHDCDSIILLCVGLVNEAYRNAIVVYSITMCLIAALAIVVSQPPSLCWSRSLQGSPHRQCWSGLHHVITTLARNDVRARL